MICRYLIMEIARAVQTRPDLGRRPKREADADDDAEEMQAAPAAPADMYDMLAFRKADSTVTTQQWLAIRLLEF